MENIQPDIPKNHLKSLYELVKSLGFKKAKLRLDRNQIFCSIDDTRNDCSSE